MLTVAFPQGEKSPQAVPQAGFAWSFITCLAWMGPWCNSVPWARNWCDAHHCLGAWWKKAARQDICQDRVGGRISPCSAGHCCEPASHSSWQTAAHGCLCWDSHTAPRAAVQFMCHHLEIVLHLGVWFKHKVLHDDKTVVRHPQHRLWVELNARIDSGVTSQSRSPLGTQAIH